MKNVVKTLLNFLVYSNIYLSFGASVVAWATLFILNLPFDLPLLFIPFAGGMFIYNLNRHTDVREDTINVPERRNFVDEYGRYFLGMGFIMYMVALYFALLKGFLTLFMALLPGIIASFYSIKRLKKYFFFKNAVVGISWGVTPLLVGFYNQVFGVEFLVLFVFFAITFFVNTVIFDVKDIVGDSGMKIETIPIKLGIKKTKTICYISNTLALFLLLISNIMGILPVRSLVLLLFLAYIYLYINRAELKDGFFYGIFVDGEFVFLYFILLLLNIIWV